MCKILTKYSDLLETVGFFDWEQKKHSHNFFYVDGLLAIVGRWQYAIHFASDGVKASHLREQKKTHKGITRKNIFGAKLSFCHLSRSSGVCLKP